MIRVYRICAERHLEDFRGLGGSYRGGGRWNLPGTPALYFASSPAVAMLEMANYIATPCSLPDDYRLGTYQLPTDIPTEAWRVRELPKDWDAYPHQQETQRMGTRWLVESSAALLYVPSAAVPGGLETSVLYHPSHPDAHRISLLAVESNIYSNRMFAGTN